MRFVILASLAHVSAAPRTDQIFLLGNPAGSQTVETGPNDAGARRVFLQRPRRGDHLIASWKVDAAGIPIEYEGRGHDYMKAPIEEHFAIREGKATWKNRSEEGAQAIAGAAFYLPINPPPEFLGVLARALLKAPEHWLALLPAGEAQIEEAGKLQIDGQGELTEYRISGLSFTPESVWLAEDGTTAASLSLLSVIAAPYQAAMGKLQAALQKTDNAWSKRMAGELARILQTDLVIRDARLFDPRDLSVTPGSSVLVRGERIIRVAPGAEIKPPAGAEIIDARGGFLMPGLWGNPQHLSTVEDGALDLANGVTSARDLGNDTDSFLLRVARYDDGTELGPRVSKAGIIDGTGVLAGPTKMRVDTPEQARQDVDWYADHGYVQIKIYSSVKPALVPVLADQAHARGMRVSGHVPAFMSARQFIEDGADEIQHFNFIELNFLFPEVKETRNRDRFIKVAEHAREFTSEPWQCVSSSLFSSNTTPCSTRR